MLRPDMSRQLSKSQWWADVAAEVADATYGKPKRPLAELVAETSRAYTRERDTLEHLAPSREMLQARLRFFLPRDVFKTAAPLRELAFANALPSSSTWRVLDVGAGLGTTSLGAMQIAEEHGAALDVFAVDRDGLAMRGLEALAKRLGMTVTTELADLTRTIPGSGTFDLIFCGLFLNELAPSTRAHVLSLLADRLAENGSLIILEPALRGPTRDLQRLRDRFEKEGPFNVFAPCVHSEPCPMLLGERDWCHEDRPFRLPDSLRPVAKEAGLRFERITYAYLTLRRDGRRLSDALPDGAARVVSQELLSKGKKELFLCGSGGHQKFVRLNRKESEPNRGFSDATRGDVLLVGTTTTKGDGQRVEDTSSVERISPGVKSEHD